MTDNVTARKDEPAAACIPDGWVLVPVHPSAEMVEAGHNASDYEFGFGVAKCVVHYRKMIAAAPVLSCDAEFALADRMARSLGYMLTEAPSGENTPSRQLTLLDDLARTLDHRIIPLTGRAAASETPSVEAVIPQSVSADAPSRAHDLIARLRTAASNNRMHADRGRDATHYLLDHLQIISKRAIADMHEEAAAALSAKDASIAEQDVKIAAMTANWESAYEHGLRANLAEYEIARLREALTKIADDTVYLPRNSRNIYTQVIVRMQETARAALRQESGR